MKNKFWKYKETTDEIIELQKQVIENQKKNIRDAMQGWKTTLDKWRYYMGIDFVMGLLMLVAGILLGISLGRSV